VIPAQINLEQVTAHYAMSSLFTSYHRQQRLYCYTVHQLDYQLQRLGTLTLAVGHLELTSEITQEGNSLVFAVLHLGGWDFHCCVQPFSGRKDYSRLKAALFDSLQLASAAYTIGVMNREFQSASHSELHTYSLRNLFDEERYRIMHLLTQETLGRLNHLYTQVYRDNYSLLMAFQRDQMEVPHELQVAAEIALEHRLLQILTALEQDLTDLTSGITPSAYSLLKELGAIATEAKQLHCKLDHAGARQVLERLILRSLDQILYTPGLIQNESVIQCLEQLVTCEAELQLNVPLESTQELYLQYVQSQTIDQSGLTLRQLKPFLRLGRTLGIAISGVIAQSA
jgi:alpha-amylase/alpha-mannosidase (GH57 family)